jgi:hypothetical protein
VKDRDLDAEFERIVAGWDAEAPDPQAAATAVDALAASATDSTTESTTQSATDSTTESTTQLPDSSKPTSAPRPGLAPAADATDPAAPPTAPTAGGFKSAGLNLPIAPTTPHAWRGAEPPVDDVDELLEASDPDDEEHFSPPTEMDLPTAEEDPMFWAIVGGLGGGPLLLLYVLFFDRGGSGWWVATSIAMIVVGFVLLVLRGGTERDPFDDGTRV